MDFRKIFSSVHSKEDEKRYQKKKKTIKEVSESLKRYLSEYEGVPIDPTKEAKKESANKDDILFNQSRMLIIKRMREWETNHGI